MSNPGLGITRIRYNGYNLSPNNSPDSLRTESLLHGRPLPDPDSELLCRHPFYRGQRYKKID